MDLPSPTKKPHPRVAKWRRWLCRIEKELIVLAQSRAIYSEVVEMVGSNPAINRGNRFYDWISGNFVEAFLMGVRRQLDRDKNSVSLMKLLQDIRQQSCLLNQEFHSTLYQPEMTHLAQATFEKAIGTPATHLPMAMVVEDIDALEEISALHKTYIDRHVAHSDRRQTGVAMATYGDLYGAGETMEKLFSKYYLLLCGADYRSLLPVVEYDWKAIFRVPWIAEAKG